MIRETDTTTDPCPRCFGRGALYMGPWPPPLEVCPDCRGTGSAVVKQYVDWAVAAAVAAEREACAKQLDDTAARMLARERVLTEERYAAWRLQDEAAAIRARSLAPGANDAATGTAAPGKGTL